MNTHPILVLINKGADPQQMEFLKNEIGRRIALGRIFILNQDFLPNWDIEPEIGAAVSFGHFVVIVVPNPEVYVSLQGAMKNMDTPIFSITVLPHVRKGTVVKDFLEKPNSQPSSQFVVLRGVYDTAIEILHMHHQSSQGLPCAV